MQTKNLPLGVIDSGVGGLSVVRELQQLLPGEDLIFVSDSANCPYGNHTAAEILALTDRMLSFLQKHKVKYTAVACNTISTLAEELRPRFPFPISSIVESAAQLVVREQLARVGLIATEFTVKSGKYQELVHAQGSPCRFSAKGSPRLAALIEHNDSVEIKREIREIMDIILSQEAVNDVILGCTHYPLVADVFSACYPSLRFIDPAAEQAKDLRESLAEKDALAERTQGSLTIYTTGDPDIYLDPCKRLGIVNINAIEKVAL